MRMQQHTTHARSSVVADRASYSLSSRSGSTPAAVESGDTLGAAADACVPLVQLSVSSIGPATPCRAAGCSCPPVHLASSKLSAVAAPGGPPFFRAARGRRAREEDGMALRGGAVRTSEERGDRRDKEPNAPRAAAFDRNTGTARCSIYSEYSSFRIAPF